VAYREKYLHRAIIAGKVLRFVPFLRMAGLNGSLVRGEDTEKSDIDFLIIARSGRLYTARFFTVLFLHLTGWRRHGKYIAGRICPNCFLSDKNPDITPANPESRKKVAEANKYMIPLVEKPGMAEKFFETNQWFNRYQVSGFEYQAKLRKRLIPKGPTQPEYFLEFILGGRFGRWLERKLMNWQVKRILAGKKQGDEIVATREEIRLHPRKFN